MLGVRVVPSQCNFTFKLCLNQSIKLVVQASGFNQYALCVKNERDYRLRRGLSVSVSMPIYAFDFKGDLDADGTNDTTIHHSITAAAAKDRW